MVTQMARARAIASRMTTRSSSVAYPELTYFVAMSSMADGENAHAPSDTAALPYPIEKAYDMITKNSADTATVRSSARGIERCGSWLSSPIDAAASKPTNSRMPSITPENTVLTDVVDGLNICSVLPLSPPWKMIARARIVIAVNETAANASIALIASRMPM